jgi:S-adenosylmethionine-dependent methyltransferase
MPTSPAVFDHNIERWNAEQDQPWQQLKYRLVQSHLHQHMVPGSWRVLDAGGGNGMESIPLATQGHQVDIVDYSKEMLADAECRAMAAGVADRMALHLGSVHDVAGLFPKATFDLVLCHNVIQYVEDVPSMLRDLAAVLKPGGLISVLSINRYSIPFRIAMPRGDLGQALVQLDARHQTAILFDTDMTCYVASEIGEMLTAAGCAVVQDYGIRCVCDYWGDNELKADPAEFKQLEALEFALADRHPYKLLGRYFQVIGRKPA